MLQSMTIRLHILLPKPCPFIWNPFLGNIKEMAEIDGPKHANSVSLTNSTIQMIAINTCTIKSHFAVPIIRAFNHEFNI